MEPIKLEGGGRRSDIPSLHLRVPNYRSTMAPGELASIELETGYMTAARFLTIEDMRDLHAWLGAAITEASPALVAAE